jgi:hypothetical protein
MVRTRRNYDSSPDPRPRGPKWVAFRKKLFSYECWGPTPLCFLCGHAIAAGLGEVQHHIAPDVRADLAWKLSNLAPVHGGGTKRCPTCGLFCNAVGAANLAPRDERGAALPFSEAFIIGAQRRLAARPPRVIRPGSNSENRNKDRLTRAEVRGRDAIERAPKIVADHVAAAQTPPKTPWPFTGPCAHYPEGTADGRCWECMYEAQAPVRRPVIVLEEPVVPGHPDEPCEFCGSTSAHRPGCPTEYPG